MDGVSKCMRVDTIRASSLRAPEVTLSADESSLDGDYALATQHEEGGKTTRLSLASAPTGSLRIGGVTFRVAEKELQVVGDVDIQAPGVES